MYRHRASPVSKLASSSARRSSALSEAEKEAIEESLLYRDDEIGPSSTRVSSAEKRVSTWFTHPSRGAAQSAPASEETENTGLQEYLAACEKLRVAPCTPFIQSLKSHIFAGDHIGLRDKGVIAISAALPINKYFTCLSLSDNGFSYEACDPLSKAITSNLMLHTLDLSDNKIGSRGAKLIAESIKYHPVINVLRLRNCNIENQGAIHLSEALQENLRLTTLDISKNAISEGGGKAVAELLSSNRTISDISVAWNCIQGEAGVAISKSVKENHCITRLDVSNNGIGAEAVMILGSIFEEGSPLKYLDISNCRLTPESTVVFAKGLEKSTHLTTLLLQNNNVGDDGAKAIFKALGVNKTIKSVSLRGCAMMVDGNTLFSEDSPNGTYTLNLSNMYQRSIALTLQRLEKEDVGKNWFDVRYNGKPMPKTFEVESYEIPVAGVLSLTYQSGKKKDKEADPLEQDDFEALMNDLKHPSVSDYDRLNTMRFASSVQHYSAAQARELISLMLDGRPYKEAKVQALTVLFPRIIDRENVPSLVSDPRMFSGREAYALRQRLGPVMSFSRSNPTGRWVLNLSVEFEQTFAVLLFKLSEQEAGRVWGIPVEQRGITLGVRDAKLDGKPFKLEQGEDMPTAGVLELNYVCGSDPEAVASDGVHSGDVLKPKPFSDSMIEDYKKTISEEVKEAIATAQLASFVAAPAAAAASSSSSPSPSSSAPSEATANSNSSKHQPVVVGEKRATRILRSHVNSHTFSGPQASSILSLFSTSEGRIEMAISLYSRLRQRRKNVQHLFTTVSVVPAAASSAAGVPAINGMTAEDMKTIGQRLGNINSFNPEHPERSYRLDLADKWDRRVARKLAELACQGEGTNWVNEMYQGQPFRFSENSNMFPGDRKEGVLEVDYVVGEEAMRYGMNEDIFLTSVGSMKNVKAGK